MFKFNYLDLIGHLEMTGLNNLLISRFFYVLCAVVYHRRIVFSLE